MTTTRTRFTACQCDDATHYGGGETRGHLYGKPALRAEMVRHADSLICRNCFDAGHMPIAEAQCSAPLADHPFGPCASHAAATAHTR